MLQYAGSDVDAVSTVRLFGLLVRGNLYACLINYLHLVSADGRVDVDSSWLIHLGAVDGVVGICARVIIARGEPRWVWIYVIVIDTAVVCIPIASARFIPSGPVISIPPVYLGCFL